MLRLSSPFPVKLRREPDSPTRWGFTQSPGKMMFAIGLLLLWIGGGCIYSFFFALLPAVVREPTLVHVVAAVVGLVLGLGVGGFFAVAGLWFAVGRSGTLVDKQAGTVTVWQRLLWWRRSASRPLHEFTDVLVEAEHHVRGGTSYWTTLAPASTDARPLRLHTAGLSAAEADALAAEFRSFLGWPPPVPASRRAERSVP
jgi:hypothetical protein